MGESTLDLDLYSVRCTALELRGGTLIASNVRDEVETLIRETVHGETGHVTGLHGRYQSKSTVQDQDVGEMGLLACVDRPDGVWLGFSIFVFASEEQLPPPMEDLQPLTELLNITSSIVGESDTDCEFSFLYALGEDLQSRIQLPSPLVLADLNHNEGVTHIESVVLSQRAGDKWEHTVAVTPEPERSMIAHEVHFTTRGILSASFLRHWMGVASEISRTLIVER